MPVSGGRFIIERRGSKIHPMKILPTAIFTLTNGKSSGRRNFSQLI